jgi:rhodanese-related sulfurtransferase
MIPEITTTDLAAKLNSEEQFILLDVRELQELAYAKLTDSRLEVAPMSRLAEEGLNALSESAKIARRDDLRHVSSRQPQWAGRRVAVSTGMEKCLQRSRRD